jgi:hypothetical protein
MKNDATIARNKKIWSYMTKRRKPMNTEQEAPPGVDETKKGDAVVIKNNRKKSNDGQTNKQ